MKRLRRALLTITTTMILMGLTLTGASAITYRDVSGHWAEMQIMRWSNLGYLTGYGDGTFGPDNQISRGALAVILTNLMGYTEEAENTFGLDENAWYLHFVLKAAQAGILPENWQETPSDLGVTREEAMYTIAKAAGLSMSETDPSVYYTDGDAVSDWAAPAVSAMREAGYAGGFPDGGVHPQGTLTRAEALTILNNIYANVYNIPGTYRKNVKGNAIINTGDVVLSNLTISGDLILPNAVKGKTITLDHVTVEGEIANLGGARVVIRNESFPSDSFTYGSETVAIPAGAMANTYDAGRFYYDENGMYTYRSNYYDVEVGIDVSAHQGKIDWQAVADSGVDFAMIRVGYRGYTVGNINLDTRFTYNIEEAKKAGLKVGVYFFSQAITPDEAIEEAEFVLEQIKDYEIDYPVVFDWETISGDRARTDGLDNGILNQCAVAFTNLVKRAGYTPAIYYYTWLGYFKYDQSMLSDYYIWYADYKEAPVNYYGFDMWQYTSSGTVPGVEGNVDMNIAFRMR